LAKRGKGNFVTVPSAGARKKSFKSRVQEKTEATTIEYEPFETNIVGVQEPYSSWMKKKTLVYEKPKSELAAPKKHYMTKAEYAGYLKDEIEEISNEQKDYIEGGKFPGWSEREWYDGWIKPQRHVDKEIKYLQKALDKHYADPKREDDKIVITLSKTPFFKEMVRKELKENHGVNNLPETIILTEQNAKDLIGVDKGLKKNSENLKKAKMNFDEIKRHKIYKRVDQNGNPIYVNAMGAYNFDYEQSRAKVDEQMNDLREFEGQQKRAADEVKEVMKPFEDARRDAKRLGQSALNIARLTVARAPASLIGREIGFGAGKTSIATAYNAFEGMDIPKEDRAILADRLVKSGIKPYQFKESATEIEKLPEGYFKNPTERAEHVLEFAKAKAIDPVEAKELEKGYENVGKSTEPIDKQLEGLVENDSERRKLAMSLASKRVTVNDVEEAKKLVPGKWDDNAQEIAEELAFLREHGAGDTYRDSAGHKLDYVQVKGELEKTKAKAKKEQIESEKPTVDALKQLAGGLTKERNEAANENRILRARLIEKEKELRKKP